MCFSFVLVFLCCSALRNDSELSAERVCLGITFKCQFCVCICSIMVLRLFHRCGESHVLCSWSIVFGLWLMDSWGFFIPLLCVGWLYGSVVVGCLVGWCLDMNMLGCFQYVEEALFSKALHAQRAF